MMHFRRQATLRPAVAQALDEGQPMVWSLPANDGRDGMTRFIPSETVRVGVWSPSTSVASHMTRIRRNGRCKRRDRVHVLLQESRQTDPCPRRAERIVLRAAPSMSSAAIDAEKPGAAILRGGRRRGSRNFSGVDVGSGAQRTRIGAPAGLRSRGRRSGPGHVPPRLVTDVERLYVTRYTELIG